MLPHSSPKPIPHNCERLNPSQSARSSYGSNESTTENSEYLGYFDDARRRIDARCSGLWNHLLDTSKLKDTVLKLGTCEEGERNREDLHALERFLNDISLTVVSYAQKHDFVHPFGAAGIIIWFGDHLSVSGDYMNGELVPDYRAAVVASYEPEVPGFSNFPMYWQQLAGVGEDKRYRDNQSGLQETYAETHCKYRIDYPTVRGFIIDTIPAPRATTEQRDRVRLTTMNARGFWCSPAKGFDELEVWVAYVCEMYEALADKITSIRPVITQKEAFFEFKMFETERLVSLLYSKKPPGRRTFIGFAIDATTPTHNTAWQDA